MNYEEQAYQAFAEGANLRKTSETVLQNKKIEYLNEVNVIYNGITELLHEHKQKLREGLSISPNVALESKSDELEDQLLAELADKYDIVESIKYLTMSEMEDYLGRHRIPYAIEQWKREMNLIIKKLESIAKKACRSSWSRKLTSCALL